MLNPRQLASVGTLPPSTETRPACMLRGIITALFVAIVALPVPAANAGLIRQINFVPDSVYHPFSLLYDDRDGNQLFSGSELIQLDSVIPFNRAGGDGGGRLDQLLAAATVPGISTGSLFWEFRQIDSDGRPVVGAARFAQNFFSYTDFDDSLRELLQFGRGRLTATRAIGAVSDFTIDFQDFDRDALLSPDEIFSFSGVTIEGNFYDTIRVVPRKIDATDGNGVSGNASFWEFSQSAGARPLRRDYAYWTYDVSSRGGAIYSKTDPQQGFDPTPVPVEVSVPATLPLLAIGLGLLGLVGTTRRYGLTASGLA